LKLAYCKITCKKDQYIINDNGREYCLTCNPCPEGTGLSPACGSKVNHPPPIDCVPCVPGKTYSTDYGPSSCKNCHICSSKENVTTKCTAIKNTICSNTCVKGYYYENTTHGCQPCSDCCGDGNDIIITECVEHGMPPSKQCTIHNAQRCKKELGSTIIFTITGTSYPFTTSSSTKGNDIGMIIGFSVMGLVIAVVVVILIRRERKKHKNKHTKQGVGAERGHVDNGAVDPLLEDNYCNIDHMIFHVKKDKGSENQISEGQTISLLLEWDAYQNGENQQNKNCFTDNSYLEWKKDDSSIANNNYQNNSKEYKIGDVKVGDSGRYYCKIKCNKHKTYEDSDAIIIHVLPGQGKSK
jgi:hypothetical protein